MRAILRRNELKTIWHKVLSLGSEFYLGIDTRGAVQPPTDEGVHYTPLPYPMIGRMLRSLHLHPGDVFVDVGCGKGRVVCCACRVPVRRVVALELNEDLLNQTLDNVRKVRGKKTPVVPVLSSAEEYDYSDATVVYLYNPFNARLTELVIEKLFLSFSRHPRFMRVVYANPVHEALFERQRWLEKYEEWPARDFPGFGYRVTFWKSAELNPRPAAEV